MGLFIYIACIRSVVIHSLTDSYLTACFPTYHIHCISLRILNNGQVLIVVDVVDLFYIALLSALEQTHCIHVACDSE